ncbi:polycystic kidney disease and receptor for egg jelly-related protein-like [Centrocercus urophasianus]|uniref:polycystic kidney disease and receptor for egg jelly-related protein-like n=1 Tax=Centrocercus urophasianus TaxID=9002 RepID=UPI001C64D7A1|nr:polycystic kidney disease and receptor for egg jelly-related protein-like [Centrocercus urophasianus]XP_042694316.1 polycystic kidney disease and receptor for egg jelly-related protein-like [Centrocercus urophasianus]
MAVPQAPLSLRPSDSALPTARRTRGRAGPLCGAGRGRSSSRRGGPADPAATLSATRCCRLPLSVRSVAPFDSPSQGPFRSRRGFLASRAMEEGGRYRCAPLRACSPRMQPPPLAVSCLGAPGRGSAGRSGEGWLSCLGNGTLRLRYRPAPGATAEAESTERQPASPPHCRWYLNWGWVKNTSLWSGQLTLQSGLSLGSALWPVASSLITVQCSSASCAAPECLYRNLSIEMSARWAAQKSSHTYRDGTRSAACLFHCSAFPGDPEKHQGFVAKVSSTRNGLTPALPSVRDDTSKATELAVLHQEAACKLNSVTIQKPPLHTSVIRQKKGTTFYLYARVLVDCNLHVSIKPQWIFYAVKDMKTNPDWDQPLNISAMHGVNTVQLTVPSWTLDYGMYQVYFTASVYVLGTKRSFSKTDRVFIEIERSDLVASIAGGNFRTVGFFDNWTLDGSVSYDPDSPERLKGLTFTWYCTKKLLDYESMRISAGNKCHPAQRDLRWLTSSGAVQVLAPESLPGNTVYHFRLVIQKDRRQSYADQSVNVQSGFSPLLDVACLENCGSAVIPTERFTLSGKCLNCQTSSQPVHHSSLWMENSSEISFDWSSTTSTASVLNYIEAAPTLPIPKAQLRESLLKAALNISVESTMEINQVVASLFQVTEQPEEVNARSQEIAITKLTEVTGVLKTQRNESRWSEQTEIQTTGILKCLSNILSAALLRRRKVNVSAVTQVFSIMENLTEIVFQGKVPGEEDTVMETSNWKITLMKDENWDVANAFSTTEACRNCFYPTLKTGNSSRLSYNAVISTALFEFDENPFPWLNYTSGIATAILGFKMAEAKANGDLLGILPEEANVLIARKDTKSLTFQLAMGPDKTQTYTTGGFSLEVNRDTKIIYIQILTKLEVAFQVLVFTGTNVTQNFPIASFDAFHNMTTVASKTKAVDEECNIKAPYIICLTESVLNVAAQGSGAQSQNISIVLLTPYITRYPNMRLVSIHTFSDHCLFLGGVQNQWREDTCRLGSLTNWQRVHCVCSMKRSHRSRSVLTASNTSTFDIKFLAAKVIVTPNRVDLKGNLIADIPKNPVTLLTVLFIFAAYFLLSLWAVRKDRAEMVSKDKIIVLPDNDPFDKVSFLVTLYTGSRWGAGTSADVFLQLIGQNGTSDIHCLRHPQFPAFRRGSTDCFLLTTKEDLGDIRAFRVWHNNRGPSPGWFLSRAKVEHVSARKTWFFMCRKWLALDKGDGLLERTFSVTNPKAPLSRKDYFLIDLASGLKEGHLWLSVFAQVLTGTYSRLQRLSSCLTILLLNLSVNIMFFSADRDEESPRHLRYLRSIAIGIECALITVPVEMIIMALFKYSQKNPERSLTLLPGNLKTWRVHLQKRKRSETSAQSGSISSPENVAAHSDSQGPTHNLRRRRTEGKTRSQGAPQNSSNCPVSEGGASTAGDKEQTGKNSRPKVKARQRRVPSNSNFSNNGAKEAGNLQEESKLLSVSSVPFCKRPPIVCCWWCVYLSWVLVIIVSGVSSFFIVLYGLSYGYQTSLEWLLASATSFIQNVFFVSIIKISCYSALKTVRPKYCENIPWFTQDLSSEIKAEKEAMNEEEMREKHFKLAQIRDTKQYKPLKDGEIAKMLETAKIKVRAFIFIKDVIGHLVVLAVVLCFAYSTENTNSFHYNQFIRNQFSPRLPAVVKLADIYTWVNDTFLPLIHNDVQPTFLTDSSSKIIGLPRMRQVRAKGTEKTCFHPHSFVNKFVISKSHCLHKYGRDLEEKGDYAGTWTKVANRSFSEETSSYPGFTYQPNRAPWTYFSYGDLHTYGPGGYTFYFFPEEGRRNSTTRLDLLQESNWLDEKTWAVIIELTTFMSDGDLFCSISVIFELSDFGIIKPTLSVHSFAVPIFHQQTKGQQLFFLAAVAFLLMYVADGLYSMVQGKKNISRTISFILKLAFFLIVPFQVLKFKMGADIVHFFLLYPNDFIPFHAASHLDQNLRNTLGFLAFLAVLKTLKYSQLFYEVRLAQRSILAALPGISSMASVVVVYFSIFMALGYLVFGQHEWNYNNMIHSAQTVFSYCVSAFRDTAFSSSRLMGGFFLTSFLLVMTCVLINLFQAVIMSAYGDRKQLVCEEPPDEARAVAFLLQRMKKMLCFPICRTAKRSDPNLCHGVPNGQAEKRVQ